jgi:hypothetical protein
MLLLETLFFLLSTATTAAVGECSGLESAVVGAVVGVQLWVQSVQAKKSNCIVGGGKSDERLAGNNLDSHQQQQT